MKTSGFCHGVQDAVNRADALLEKISDGVYLFGDLANNSKVMQKYHEQGYIVTTDIADIAPGSTVVIRAHGLSRRVVDDIVAIGVNIEDCTCTKVKRIHNIVAAASGRVIIVGKKDHPEVTGIRGWCNCDAIVLETETDFAQVPRNIPFAVVGQTTCKPGWWQKAVNYILQICPDATIHDTLCDVVTNRLSKAAEIAAEVGSIVVVGDTKSANSVELYNACAGVNPNTIFVASLAELIESGMPQGSAGVAVVGSTSTRQEVVDEITAYLQFATFAAVAKAEIDDSIQTTMHDVFANHDNNPIISTALQDLFHQNDGGKRIRGIMIKLGEKVSAGTAETYLTVAMAYELFQTSILIHDDIIDKSTTRRGKQTIHTVETNSHFGISRALCIGDYGMFWASHFLADAPIRDMVKVRLMTQFSKIQLITLEGELMDVTLPEQPWMHGRAANACARDQPISDWETYQHTVMEIYTRKTAWYTLAGPLMLGAICGGASDELLYELREIALPLGIAFQIKDDLLGIFAESETLGKPAAADIEEGKLTLIYGYAHQFADPVQRMRLDALYGKPCTGVTVLEIREIFMATGAVEFADRKIAELSSCCLERICNSQIDDECKTLLRGLVAYLTTREY